MLRHVVLFTQSYLNQSMDVEKRLAKLYLVLPEVLVLARPHQLTQVTDIKPSRNLLGASRFQTYGHGPFSRCREHKLEPGHVSHSYLGKSVETIAAASSHAVKDDHACCWPSIWAGVNISDL
jgi:hypothetical protein